MKDEIYRQYLLTMFNHMQHKHALEDATYALEGYNASCGDRITMYVKTADDGTITDASFLGDGCLLSQVSAEMISDAIIGKQLQNVSDMTLDELLDMLQVHPTPTRMRCVELSLMSVKRISSQAN